MTDIKLPPMPDDIDDISGPIWRHIVEWSSAEPGQSGSDAADAIDAAITRVMRDYAREAVRLNAQADANPIYQYQLATGEWIDQTRDSYEYNKANGVKGLRIVYEAAPQPAQQPLTDERLRQMHHEDEFGLFCDYDDFEQIARAIEQELGIGVKND